MSCIYLLITFFSPINVTVFEIKGAPGAHISADGRTFFPELCTWCVRVFSTNYYGFILG